MSRNTIAPDRAARMRRRRCRAIPASHTGHLVLYQTVKGGIILFARTCASIAPSGEMAAGHLGRAARALFRPGRRDAYNGAWNRGVKRRERQPHQRRAVFDIDRTGLARDPRPVYARPRADRLVPARDGMGFACHGGIMASERGSRCSAHTSPRA
jgi:hypothetical protein